MSNLLSIQQTQAVSLLAQGMPDSAIAREIGCDRSTLWRWKQNPVFMTAVDTELELLQKEVKRILKIRTVDAASRIGELVNEEECPHHVQLASAKEVLNRVAAIAKEEAKDTIPLTEALRWVDGVCSVAINTLENNAANLFHALGFVDCPVEYLAWSDSQKMFYACVLAWFADGRVDDELIDLWRWAWEQESPEGRQWLVKETPLALD